MNIDERNIVSLSQDNKKLREVKSSINSFKNIKQDNNDNVGRSSVQRRSILLNRSS